MMDSLPSIIREEIFLRLPIKCLIRCTAVRKSWRSMIKNPTFIGIHLKRTLNSDHHKLLLLHGSNIVEEKESYSDEEQQDELDGFGSFLNQVYRFCSFLNQFNSKSVVCEEQDPEDEEHDSFLLYFDAPAFDKYCKIEVPGIETMLNGHFRVVGTCNGLVCFANDYDRGYSYNFVISNPIVRKSVTLPMPNVRCETHGEYYASVGFGFDAVTNDYKVVRLVTLLTKRNFEEKTEKTVAEVYSLSTGCWRYLGLITPQYRITGCNPQAFVNGVLHWDAMLATSMTYCILTFDVARELFSEIMMPESFRWDGVLELKLSVSGDRKSIALFTSSATSFDIWEMKEYGVHESWTKLMRLPHAEGLPRPVCFRKSGELLVYKGNLVLFSLELGSKQFKSLGISGTKLTADPCEMSLILLDMDTAVSY